MNFGRKLFGGCGNGGDIFSDNNVEIGPRPKPISKPSSTNNMHSMYMSGLFYSILDGTQGLKRTELLLQMCLRMLKVKRTVNFR